MTAHPFLDRINRFGYRLIVVVAATSLVLGLEATLLRESSLLALGNGPGGLFGLPLFFLLIPVALTLPSLVLGVSGVLSRPGSGSAYLIAFAGAALAWLTFAILSHGLDLCNWGIWDKTMRYDGTPLCEGFPPRPLGINPRFHLLLHAAPTALVVVLYGLALRRWLPQTFRVDRAGSGEIIVTPSFVDRLNGIGLSVIVATMAVSTVLGTLAVLFGGELSLLGEGLGGLYNFPILAFLATVVLAVPALLVGLVGLVRGDRRQGRYALAFVGSVAVLIFFILFAHAIDPCDNGWWSTNARYNGIPMCQRFGDEWNIHNRFHLLMHTLPTWLVVIPYWLALRRWLPQTFVAEHDVRQPAGSIVVA